MVTAGTLAATEADETPALSPTGEVLRDIARGGIAGALVGIVVGGLGARLVMRVAAILHPDAVYTPPMLPSAVCADPGKRMG